MTRSRGWNGCNNSVRFSYFFSFFVPLPCVFFFIVILEWLVMADDDTRESSEA